MALPLSYAVVTLLSLSWEERDFGAYAELRNLCSLKMLVLLENERNRQNELVDTLGSSTLETDWLECSVAEKDLRAWRTAS